MNITEEAVNFYVSLFENSKIVSLARYGDEVPGMQGKVLTAVFQLNGQEFMALDGGQEFKFTEAISFYVNCQTQAEVDHLWDKLTAEGEAVQCGWLKDKYGLSWQIVPSILGELLQDKDATKASRVMQAMLKMTKIDSEILLRAYNPV